MKVHENLTFTKKNGTKVKGYYIDENLAANLDLLKKAVTQNWDGFIMVDGVEGSAKSTLAGTIGHYLAPETYGADSLVFTQDQFFDKVDNAAPNSVIHWDEFIFGGLSTEALNRVQNSLIKKITTIRKKQLFVMLVMPWFFMMRPYFAVGRSRCLIHTYTPDGVTRGYFNFYSYIKKQKLYLYGKKEYNYGAVRCDFGGRFTNQFGYFWDEKEYDKLKEAAIQGITENNELTKQELKYRQRLRQTIFNLRYMECEHCQKKPTVSWIGQAVDMDRANIHTIIKQIKIEHQRKEAMKEIQMKNLQKEAKND